MKDSLNDRKKQIFTAVLVGICISAVALGLLFSSSDSDKKSGEGYSVVQVQSEPPVEAAEQKLPVINNGGTIIQVGEPCDPEEKGWRLSEAIDVQGDEQGEQLEKLLLREERDGIYLIKQKGNFTLYGSGDLERMLLKYGDSYAEIHYPYLSNYGIAPVLFGQDYDGDGQQELAIRLQVLHGTGVYIDTLLMADREGEELYVYQYPEEDFFGAVNSHLTCERHQGEQGGLQAFLDEFPAGPVVMDEEGMAPFSSCMVGNLARFEFDEFPASGENYGDIKLWTDLEFYADNSVISWSNGASICGDVVYQKNGKFSLENLEVRDRDLESYITIAIEEQFGLEPEGRRFVTDIQYGADQLAKGFVEAEVTLQSQTKPDTYEKALVTMKRMEPESGRSWRTEKIVMEE